MQTTLRLLIVAIWLVGLSHCACTKDHPKVGLTSELSTLDHDVEGTVVVVDDCSFRVDGFKYDGTGPDVFWYAADERKNLASGFIMDSIPRSKGVWDGTEVVSIKLPGGTTWDDVNIISVWCRQFGVNFGDAVLPEPKESVPEEPPSKKEENENGSLMAQSSLLVVLGTLVVSILVGPT